MSAPSPFLSTTFTDGEGVDNTKLFTRVLSWLNSLLTFVIGYGQGRLGGGSGSATTTLTAASTYIACSSSYTFTLASTRRVRIAVSSDIQIATAPARYLIRAAYNTGSSVGTPTPIGTPISINIGATGTNGIEGGYNEYTALLTAGTYTAYAVVFRLSGGSATDQSVSNWVEVYDVGGS